MNGIGGLALPAFSRKWQLLFIVLGIIGLSILSGMVLPEGIDWHLTFRPVSLLTMEGKSPYTSELPMPFPYPPWALLPIVPLGLLPEQIGRGAFFVISAIGFTVYALRMGANRVTVITFLLSPPVLHCLLNANLDWIALLGFVVPPPFGVFLLIVKPQVGIGGLLFWLFISWKKGGIKETIRVFAPVTILMLASFLIYGLWPLSYFNALSYSWNASLWPMSIPVGLGLMVLALRKQKIRYSMAASPCFSPYVLFHSWAGVMGAVLTDKMLSIAAFVGLWAAVIIQALR